MSTTIRSAFVFLLSFILTASLLLSCDGNSNGDSPKSPEGAAVQKALNKLSKADSYTVKTVISYAYSLVDDRLTAKSTQTEQYADLQSEDYRHHSATEVDYETPGNQTWDVADYTLSEGYQDGRLYFSSVSLEAYASMTPNQYKTYLSETALFDPLAYVDDCEKKSSDTIEGGGRTFTFSGFTAEAVSRFMSCVSPYVSHQSGAYFAYDLEATVKIDEDGYPQQVEVNAKYKSADSENNKKTPTVTLKRYYSEIDDTEVQSVNFVSYKESEQLPALRRVIKALNDLKYQESLSFERTMDYAYSERSSSGDRKINKGNTTEGSLTNKDGAFRGQWKTTAGSTYIDYVYNGSSLDTEDFHSVYKGGKYQEETINTSEECWDAKAMQILDDFLVSGHFPIQQINSIRTMTAPDGGTVYTFTYNDTDFKLFDSSARNYATPSKSTEIAVKIADGKVVSYTYDAYSEYNSHGTEYIYDGRFHISYSY